MFILASDLSSLKSSGSDRSICTELVQQGILKQEDAKKVLSPDDEILQEIKKCQQELAAVNEHNVRQLNKLKMFLIKDQKRLEVKAALKQLDRQVFETRNKYFFYVNVHRNMFFLDYQYV